MFLDTQDLTDDRLEADVCVIGAGAVGIAIAQALRGSGRSVLLVESGGFEIDPEAQALFKSESIGEYFEPGRGRYRTFGGSTSRWTGRCAKLDPLDLEQRSWVPDSGWPIDFGALDKHYDDAAALCGFGPDWNAVPGWFEEIKALPNRPSALDPFLWRFFAVDQGVYQHFGKRFQEDFRTASDIRVITHADVVGVDASPDGGRITSAWVRTRSGERIQVTAQRFALCCGGIENARLLLNWAAETPEAFHTVSDSVGRWFMQHPRAETATIRPERAQCLDLQSKFNNFGRVGLHYECGFALSKAAQIDHHLVNASAVLRYSFPADRIAMEALTHPLAFAGAVRRRLGGQPGKMGYAAVAVHVDLEQVPDRDSRIKLGPEKDRIGLRTAAIDWRIAPVERKTAYHFTKAIKDWLAALGLGKAKLAAGLEETGGLTTDNLQDSYHHIGATRMSETPDRGVVDRNLKVHGLSNLYVCGASVMPTGGHANPTLTLAALALRLAEHLLTTL